MSFQALRTPLYVAAHSWLPILYVKLWCLLLQANQSHVQIKYYASAGDRATSDAAIPVKPNSSIRFTGRADILTKLKEHFTAESTDNVCRRKFFLLYGMGGIGKTQICLRAVEDMSD